jgi:hypothetical protein
VSGLEGLPVTFDYARVRHVYCHPSNAERACELVESGCPQAMLHVDPECPPERIYYCEGPLQELER